MTLVVPHRVSVLVFDALQSPGLVVLSKPTVVSMSSPADVSIRDCDAHQSSPLHLPVTATSQLVSTQHLRPAVEPVWMLRVRLLIHHRLHLPVVVGHFEVFMNGVHVQLQFPGV